MKIYFNSYNICRTSLAIGTLLTIITNSSNDLFGTQSPSIDFEYYRFSLFVLFNPIIAKVIAIIGLLSVISGFYPRFTGVIHWYISYSFIISCEVFDGGDQVSSNLSLLLLPLTLLDSSKNHWTNELYIWRKKIPLELIQKTFFTLIIIQVSVIYLHAFVGKVFIEEWINGTAAYYWLTNKYFGVAPFLSEFSITVLANEYVTTLITWGTLFLEFTLASFIFVNRNDDKKRYLLFIIAVIFHFLIFVSHGLASFFFAMFAALTIYLIPENKSVTLNL